MNSPDKHELTCPYANCPGRLAHLVDDLTDAEGTLRAVLENYGVEGKIDDEGLAAIRNCYRRLRDSAAA